MQTAKTSENYLQAAKTAQNQPKPHTISQKYQTKK